MILEFLLYVKGFKNLTHIKKYLFLSFLRNIYNFATKEIDSIEAFRPSSCAPEKVFVNPETDCDFESVNINSQSVYSRVDSYTLL